MMVSNRSNQRSRNRFQSGLLGQLTTSTCFVVAVVILNGSLLCLICCASESPGTCCRMESANRAAPTASAPTEKRQSDAGHNCCRPQHKNNNGDDELSKSQDPHQCCSRDPQTLNPALLQSLDHQTIASTPASQTVGINASSQPPGCTWRSPVTNRGSTYLLCCVLLI
jgi:hypothetical protein